MTVVQSGSRNVLSEPPEPLEVEFPLLTAAGVAAVASIGLVSYLLAIAAAEEEWVIAWSGIALAAVGISSMLVMGRPTGRALATLRLGPWFALGFAVTFGLATLGIAFPIGEATQGLGAYVDADLARESVPLLTLSMATVALVYRIFPSRWSHGIGRLARRQARQEVRTYGRPLVIFGLGVAATLLLIRSGTYGYASDAASLVESANPFTNIMTGVSEFTVLVAFWMAWRAAKTREIRAGLLCFVASATGFAFGLAAGMKEYAALPLLAAAFGWSSSRARTNWVGLIAVGVMFVAVVYPVVNAYRDAVTTGSGRLVGTSGVEQLSGVLDERASLSQTGDALAMRLARLPDFSVILSLTPEVIPYRDLSELSSAPVLGLVPRAIWPDKPVLSTGYEFSQEYYGRDARIYTSSAVTPEGDLYRHGGWFVLLAGGGAMGLLLRVLDSASHGARDPRLYFISISVFGLVAKHETDFIGFIAALPTALALTWVALRISGVEQNRPL